jgi:predicted transcriptional regulator
MDAGAELVAFVARAENRLDALLALAEAPATRPELQAETGIPRATLSRILADFRDKDLAIRHGQRYVLTPLGELLSAEIASLLDSVEAMQRLDDVRQWLSIEDFDFPVERLADADVIVPSTQDPTAPIRRAEALLGEATSVRVVANSMIPGCLEAVWRAVTEGRQTLEWVTTPDALDVVAADPVLTRQTRELLESKSASGYVHEGGFPQALFVVDETLFTPVSDDSGTVQGHIETHDEVVRAWAGETIDGYVREAEPVTVDVLTA